jgi:hypothetical protein
MAICRRSCLSSTLNWLVTHRTLANAPRHHGRVGRTRGSRPARDIPRRTEQVAAAGGAHYRAVEDGDYEVAEFEIDPNPGARLVVRTSLDAGTFAHEETALVPRDFLAQPAGPAVALDTEVTAHV